MYLCTIHCSCSEALQTCTKAWLLSKAKAPVLPIAPWKGGGRSLSKHLLGKTGWLDSMQSHQKERMTIKPLFNWKPRLFSPVLFISFFLYRCISFPSASVSTVLSLFPFRIRIWDCQHFICQLLVNSSVVQFSVDCARRGFFFFFLLRFYLNALL